MIRSFRLLKSARFELQAPTLSDAVLDQLEKALNRLAANPRHPSLRTHEVQGTFGDYGGKIFEAYVSMKYRITWEYGPRQGEITLRNVDNHDECLRRP